MHNNWRMLLLYLNRVTFYKQKDINEVILMNEWRYSYDKMFLHLKDEVTLNNKRYS